MTRFLIILTSVLMLTGCDKLSKVKVTATSETTVQGSGLPNFLNFGGDFASFDITQTTAFENNNIARSNIGDSYVTRFYLEVTSEEGDLSFINGMKVYFDYDDDPNNGNETLVAYIQSGDEPESGQRKLELSVESEADIGDYLRQQDLYVHSEANGSAPNDNTTIRAEMDILVNLVW